MDASNRTTADERDAVGAVLHGELGNKVLSIPGMDGFFTYELVYRQVCLKLGVWIRVSL